VRKTGSTGRNACTVPPCGTLISSTMTVMMIAITPSLNASNLPLGISSPVRLQ